MSNMSYCRFQNTSNDVEECIHALENKESLSEKESRAAAFMFIKVLDYCKDNGIIRSYSKNCVAEHILSFCKKNNEGEED